MSARARAKAEVSFQFFCPGKKRIQHDKAASAPALASILQYCTLGILPSGAFPYKTPNTNTCRLG